ncbi:DUF4438 domain-containing protein [Candidatus Bathyarchaeota archaeon]|nr:DUF4438 domain-containing protein [Candidatus Bathyarchaeota archaeon]
MLKTNKDSLVATQVTARVSHPSLTVHGGLMGSYVATWDGRLKLGIGPGGIKYNVRVGSPCFGWPDTEYLEPGVTLKEVEAKPAAPGYQSQGAVATTVQAVTCVGNKVTVTSGDAKGAVGVVTGKGRGSIHSHFADADLENLSIGDRVKIRAEGVGLKVEGFDGDVFNMSPDFLEAMSPEVKDGVLTLPAAKEIPAHAMGYGVGGSEAQRGYICIQSSPPSLVEELGLGNLRIGDLVALRDTLVSYGKGYHRGAVTVGVVVFGASEVAGQGPGVMAIAASKKGMIEPKLERDANVAKYLGVEA